jgi:WD40 repeat protein
LTNDKVVTASEDQTCMVWDLTKKNPELLYKLTGHTKAVTSVDWQVMDPKIGEIFVSCSDDQTIRIYDPKDAFKLVDIIATSFVEEWHTLTYLRLEQVKKSNFK